MKNLALALFAIIVTFSYRSDASFESMEDWCVDRMITWAPPGRPTLEAAKETNDETLVRFHAIARDAMEVAYDPSEEPLFPGSYGRSKTLALMLAIADSESGFRKDVDLGIGSNSKGDSGASWCLMQVKTSRTDDPHPTRIYLRGGIIGYSHRSSEGFSGQDLVLDRKACFRVGLHIIRLSFNVCSNLPILERLAAYTSGSCGFGRDASKNRVSKAVQWFTQAAPPSDDSPLIGYLGDTVSSASTIY